MELALLEVMATVHHLNGKRCQYQTVGSLVKSWGSELLRMCPHSQQRSTWLV